MYWTINTIFRRLGIPNNNNNNNKKSFIMFSMNKKYKYGF